jgi:chemotaxis protein MotB
MERSRVADLETELGTLSSSLVSAQDQLAEQTALIAALTQERDTQAAALSDATNQITAYEAQVAGLLAQQSQNQAAIQSLEADKQALLSEQQALSLALATARDEIDLAAEEARRKAAERDALQALIASLKSDAAAAQVQLQDQSTQIADLNDQLSAAEAAQLVSAAAAQDLRKRLENADAELTAMTLALEQQRKQAEDTLTLLAAADQAKVDLQDKLNDAMFSLNATITTQQSEIDRLQTENRENARLIQDGDLALAAALARQVALEQQLQAQQAQAQLAQDQSKEQEQQLTSLQQDLVQALAALKSEQTANVELERTQADLQSRLDTLQSMVDQSDTAVIRTATLEQKLAEALANQLSAQNQVTDLRSQLETALAARLAADELAQTETSEKERINALLQNARQQLADASSLATKQAQDLIAAEKQTALLNQQVATLRQEMQKLQGLLEQSEVKDIESQAQLENMGNRLNAALARVASEERKNRKLEEAERLRLQQERDRLASQAEELAKYRSEFFGRMREILAGQDGVQIVGDRFVFSSEVLFDPGQAELQSTGMVEIEQVATILKSVMNDIPDGVDWVLRVDGHTDNIPLSGTGEFRDNWELSQARALSVVRYMVDDLGMPADRMAANGFGEYQPISDENAAQARARNRRIEIKLTER